MKTELFNFNLPKKLIAQKANKKRDNSKLLYVNKNTKKIKDDYFYNIIKYLKKGDVLVVNNTKVIPVKIYGIKEKTGAVIECLLTNKLKEHMWEVLIKKSKKININDTIVFVKNDILKAKCVKINNDGKRILKFYYNGIFEDILNIYGEMPLPPYIKIKLNNKNKNRYQTVYFKKGFSIAAPTAGLHFSRDLIKNIKKKGIIITNILLNIGLGTFQSVKTKNIENHKIHKEYYEISKKTAFIINKAKKENRKIIAVGTTTVRALETIFNLYGKAKETKGWTDIFITPGYKYKCINALITNFHLPKSTLIMLISSLIGINFTKKIYSHAINKEYHFFSFGDAMYIE